MFGTVALETVFKNEHIYIDLSEFNDAFPFILGRVNYIKAHKPLALHQHPSMMEIVLMIKGCQIYRVQEKDYSVSSGEIFFTYPDEMHSTGQTPEDKSLLYFLMVNLERCKGVLGYNLEEGTFLSESLSSMKKRVFKGDAKLRPILDEIITVYSSDHPLKKTLIRNLISDFLVIVLKCESRTMLEADERMNNVLEYIQTNIFDDIHISDLAKISGISVSRFKANFKKITGIPPGEYILRQKVEKAKFLLSSCDKTITEIAHLLAFTSSQYFATVFRRFALVTPKEYRAGI